MKLHVDKDSWYCFVAQETFPSSSTSVEFTPEEYEYYQTAIDYEIGLQNLLERKYKEQNGKAKESGNETT